MNFGFLSNVPWFKGAQPNNSLGTGSISTSALMEQPKPKPCFDIKLWRWSFSLYLPGAVNNGTRFQRPTTINRELKRRAQFRGVVKNGDGVTDLRFRPYVSKVPWHTGVRGFLSQLFPRYGHYCGPNWSSGKDGGSHVWDKRPIDWLDFCCYCHDIGYDTHDQAELLKADLAFLECLERPHMSTKGDARVAHIYKTMCTTGIRKFLIPYRTYLVKLRSRQPLFQFEWLNNVRWRSRNFEKT
ncbi:Phospholipase A2 family protein [Quillaja saponaria]|uniref:Phospholipase A2 family protein n=1 Tax=Quillaja saponaria TaxID=32244 RepID=A0AAD7LLV8_QUISA|nr:Phospholipase A2 family protein [Quillaja saponaria]